MHESEKCCLDCSLLISHPNLKTQRFCLWWNSNIPETQPSHWKGSIVLRVHSSNLLFFGWVHFPNPSNVKQVGCLDPVGGTMFYFPSWKMIYSDSFTMFYTFMRSKTKFYRSKNDMMDKVLHLQRQMNNVLLGSCSSRTKFYLDWLMLDIVLQILNMM